MPFPTRPTSATCPGFWQISCEQKKNPVAVVRQPAQLGYTQKCKSTTGFGKPRIIVVSPNRKFGASLVA
jgi:hypothetical protein